MHEKYKAPGNETVIASYSGDGNTFSSSGQASVTVGQAATSTALSDRDGSLTLARSSPWVRKLQRPHRRALARPDRYGHIDVDGRSGVTRGSFRQWAGSEHAGYEPGTLVRNDVPPPIRAKQLPGLTTLQRRQKCRTLLLRLKRPSHRKQ